MQEDKNPTDDLSEFGFSELEEAARLLTAYTNPKTDTSFLNGGIKLWFNKNSGCVFLCDEDFNVAMMNGDNLEQFFSCLYCGHEGFKEDMKHEPEDKECTEYLNEIVFKVDE